jgi:hypothetical protein
LTSDRRVWADSGHPEGVGHGRRSDTHSLQRKNNPEGSQAESQVLLRGPRRQGQGGGSHLRSFAQQEAMQVTEAGLNG